METNKEKRTFSTEPDFDCTKTEKWKKLKEFQKRVSPKVKFDVALVTNL